MTRLTVTVRGGSPQRPAVVVVPVCAAAAATLHDVTGLTPERARQLTSAGRGWARIPMDGTGFDALLVNLDETRDLAWALSLAAAGAGARLRDTIGWATTLTTLGPDPYAAAATVIDRAVVGGWDLAGDHAGGAPGRTGSLELWDDRIEPELLAPVALRAHVVAEAVNLARDLVDMPPRDAGPAEIADIACETARACGITAHRIEADDLAAAGLPGLLAVGRASSSPPVAVRLRHGPAGSPPVALLGKGVTFDSGGLDLKTNAQMLTMKQDMAGAAAVLAATTAAARLDLTVAIDAWLLLCENMPGGAALRPGDVIRHVDGTTSEVVTPDAEGRLILADALHLAAGEGAAALVDVATLTGGGGLGPDLWAAVGSSPTLVGELVAAGSSAGEPGWALPYWPAYGRYLRSPVADRRNAPADTRYPFPTVAVGAYLGQFTQGVPWAHLDTSAVASTDDPPDPAVIGPRATGSPTRTLVHWLEQRAARPEVTPT